MSKSVLFVLHYKRNNSKSDQNVSTLLDYTPFYITHNVFNRVINRTLWNQKERKSNQSTNFQRDYTPFYIIHRKSCWNILYMWRKNNVIINCVINYEIIREIGPLHVICNM